MKNNKIPICYFFIHLCVEIICFYSMYRFFHNSTASVLIAFVYDMLAFVPQGLIGEWIDKHQSFDAGSPGNIMLGLSVLLFLPSVRWLNLIGLLFLTIGNAIIHECGAIATTYNSNGKIFPAALFVSGGSFGLIIGQTMGKAGINAAWMLIPVVIIEFLILFTNKDWVTNSEAAENKRQYPQFNAVKENIPIAAILIVAFVVTTVRGFVGYAIPTSWKTELWQAFLLYFCMGFGKAFGGWCADRFGYKKTGCISTILCIPFLIFGDKIMVLSVVGVMMFSMTMSITFAMALSVLRNHPGAAFGLTTIGLFIGTVPIFIWHFSGVINVIFVIAFSLLCFLLLFSTLQGKPKNKNFNNSGRD